MKYRIVSDVKITNDILDYTYEAKQAYSIQVKRLFFWTAFYVCTTKPKFMTIKEAQDFMDVLESKGNVI